MAPLRLSLFAFLTFISGTLLAGNLKVNLAPSQAVSAGARWRVDGGTWRTSGTNVTNLTNVTHTVDYNTITGWFAPSPVSVTVTNGGNTTITGTYAAPSSLKVTLTPSTGQWRVDGGAWQNSGTTATGLAPGAHSVSYNALTNYIAPATESVTLVAGQATNLARTYTATSSLTVTLTPSTGSWQIDGGAWRASGTTASGLTPGAHTVSYSALANHTAPATESVTLISGQTTTLTRAYTATSSLTLTLTPSSGTWRVDGGAWQPSGTTLSGLTPGVHAITYNALANHIAPGSENVTLVSGQTTSLARSYTETSSLSINLAPSNGTWRVDGGPWQPSGATLSGLTLGAHTVNYSALANYLSPSTETVTLVSGPGTNLTRNYTATSNLTVTLTPSSGYWKLDGVGNWRDSGTTATGLTPGNHTIAYTGLSAMISPPDESVTLPPAQTTSLARSYTPAGQIFVMLNPNTAQWRVDGGAWRATHTYTGWIAAGSHTIEYSPLPGMLTPAPQPVTVAESQTLSISKTYVTESALIVNLTPAVGQWRIDGGAWQNSGTRVGQLTQGYHAVEYSNAPGYLAPAAENILLNGSDKTIARNYLRPGAVTVNVVPAEGQWRLTNGEWQASGATLSGLRPGYYSIEFTSVPGWFDLPNFYAIAVAEDQTTTATYTHVRHATITATLAPGAGQWRVNGGAWQPSGGTVGALSSGNYTVDYSTIPGFTPLPSETIALAAGEQKSINRSYSGSSSLTVTLSPSGGKWSVDGGPWRDSGTTASGLTAGGHSISYGALANHIAPATETVTLGLDENASLSRSYTANSSLTIILTPSTGSWQIDGGAWQNSGTTASALTPGVHTISYSALADHITPEPENVTLVAGQTTLLTRIYTATSSLAITLTPSTGSWRIDGGSWLASGTTVTGLTPGNHSIAYSNVSNMLTPPAESVTLPPAQTTSLTRSYTAAGQIFVTLIPGTAQWRVDSGAWRASNTNSGLIAAGPHTVEYSTLENYIAPPTETVTVAASQTLAISRTYTAEFGATLTVKTIPAYLSEVGVVQWRLDGGSWNTAGAPVSVSPGTHTLEFQPVAGLDVPPASSVTISAGATETLEATFYLTHRLRFFLHPDLVAGLSTQDLQTRLSQYAADLQTIWHRESLRRLTFNPATDISILSVSPFSGNAYPPLPEFGFELWAHADSSNGSIYGSNGGFAGLDVSGAGGADGMHWTQIYDPSALAPGSTELYEYWKQINAITHEFEHVFGAGMGEYYSFTGFDDLTGVAPFYDVDYFAPADPFWNAHPDFWGDPLLRTAWDNHRIGNPTAHPELLAAVHFSATSRGIINGCYRNADSPFTTRTALPDLTRVRVSIVDASTGQPISSASLRVWNRPNPGPDGGQEGAVVTTGTPGVFEFHWTSGVDPTPLNNWENGRLLKAFATGYQPKAQWEWIYDGQRVKTVDNADVWEITVALDPAP
jgi:hypothetical protein